MANETSIATEATRDAAVQSAAGSAGGVSAHMSGDWWQHNQVNRTDTPWEIAASDSPADQKHGLHTVGNTGQLRLLVTIGGVDTAIVVPFIDSGAFVGNGTWSGSPNATAPEFVTQPQGVSIALGDQAILECSVIGTPPILVRWTKNGEPVSGADTTTLFFSNFQEDQAGHYVCIATNANGQTLSEIAIVTVQTTTGEPVPTRPY